MTIFWMWVPGLVGIYCIVQAVRDFRAGNRLWAAAAAIGAALILLMPVETHAVKIDLPASVQQA